MALADYEGLRQKIINQSHRSDLDLQIDDFIQLAETEMRANPDESLKMNEGEVITVLNTLTTTALLPLPVGYQKARSSNIKIGETLYSLEYRTPDQMRIRSGTGQPCFFTINANQIEFDVVPDIVYEVTFKYFAEFAPLTSSNTTNFVLTKYPNIYLYGCMAQVGSYTNEEQLEAIYNAKFLDSIRSANNAEREIRYGPQPSMKVKWAP